MESLRTVLPVLSSLVGAGASLTAAWLLVVGKEGGRFGRRLLAAGLCLAGLGCAAAGIGLPQGVASAAVGGGSLLGVGGFALERRFRQNGLLAGLLLFAGSSLLLLGRPGTAQAGLVLGGAIFWWWIWGASAGSLRERAVVVAVVTLVGAALAVALPTTWVLARRLRSGELERLEGLAVARANSLDLVRATVSQAGLVLAQNRSIQDQLTGGRFLAGAAEEFRRQLFPYLDFLAFLDSRGVVLDSSGLSSSEALGLSGSEEARSALDGVSSSSLDLLPPGGVAVLAASPVRSTREPERVAGAVAAGIRLDRDWSERVRAESGVEVAILRRGAVVASSLRVSSPAELLGRGVAELERAVLEKGERTRILGRGYVVSAVPLTRPDGEIVAALALAAPQAGLERLEAGTARVSTGLALLGVLLVGGAGAALGERLARPLVEMAAAVKAFRLGGPPPVFDTGRPDEIGDLSRAFREMAVELEGAAEGLSRALRQEAELRSRLEAMMAGMSDAFLAVDPANVVVAANPAAESLAGLPSGEMLGKRPWEVLPLKDSSGRDLWDVLLSTGSCLGLAGKEGKAVAARAASFGEGAGKVVLLRDITREAEAERMKRAFLANVSHELRTPLTPIRGFVDLILRKDPGEEERRKMLEAVREAASRMERVVGILLDFAAMEGGALAARTEPLDLAALAEECVASFLRREPAREFSVVRRGRVPPARADPHLARRALEELLDNAVKYSPGGGPVRVEVSASRENGRWVRLAVIDSGVGVDPAFLPQVFGDFTQEDPSSTRRFGGLGLGLAFVRRVMEAHGGKVEAESSPGEGSTFSLLFPEARAGVRKRARVASRGGRGGGVRRSSAAGGR